MSRRSDNRGRHDITVAGLGVAGSTLAYQASRHGFKVAGYDVAPIYRKACGDVVSVRGETWRIVKETGSMLTGVKKFSIRVGGTEVAYIDVGGPVWVVVDKSKLVNTLRELAASLGASIFRGKLSRLDNVEGIAVDARGPYSRGLEDAVITFRVIAECVWEPDTALIDFNVKNRGFYWVFPADADGRLVNLGAGFEKVKDGGLLRRLTLAYYRRVCDARRILDERGAPIQVHAPINLHSGKVLRVGEAGGLLNRTSGEGNRHAMLSSLALVEALRASSDLNEIVEDYSRRVSGLVNEVNVSRALLKTITLIGRGRGEELLVNAPRTFWVKWLKSELTWDSLARIVAGSPSGSLKALKSLLVASLRNSKTSTRGLPPSTL